MTIGQWQAKAKAKMVVVGGLKIMRKLTFAPFLCLLAFSPPTNTRNTQYKARASRKHGRRQGWSHHFGLLLLLGLYLFMLFLGLTLHAWQNPGFLDTIHPPNPLLDYLKFMAFFFFYIFLLWWLPLYCNRLSRRGWSFRAACRLQDTIILLAGRELVENTFTWCVERLSFLSPKRTESESESEWKILLSGS